MTEETMYNLHYINLPKKSDKFEGVDIIDNGKAISILHHKKNGNLEVISPAPKLNSEIRGKIKNLLETK